MTTNSRYSWLAIGLATMAVSAIGTLSARRLHKRQTAFVNGEPVKVEVLSSEKPAGVYTHELKPIPTTWTPPAWLFGPGWTYNNYLLLRGLQQLLASPKDFEEKKNLLYLQAGIWGIFFSLGHAYFKRKGPALAAAWTIADATFAALSFQLAHTKNRKLGYLYLPLLAWTSVASTVASAVQAKKTDSALKT